MTTNRSGRLPGDDDRTARFNLECPQTEPDATEAEQLARLSFSMLTSLSRTIEGEIVPRLLMAFDTDNTALAQDLSEDSSDVVDIDEFVLLLIRHDATVASRYIDELRSAGTPLQAIYLDVLAPAARRLGQMWENDECSFTDVTVGMCRMNQVLLDFSRCFGPHAMRSEGSRTALIVPVPGEQHTFGLIMVIDFLRRAGWNCWSGTPRTSQDLIDLIQEQYFDVVGLSVSGDDTLDAVSKEIDRIRRRSHNRETIVMVGGGIVAERPELAESLGADVIASDGPAAVKILDRLCPAPQGGVR